jgi:hypothetical protein
MWFWYALGGVLIVAGLGVFVVMFFFLTDNREAFALIRVKRVRPAFLPDRQPIGAESDREYDEYRQTQMVLAKSRMVLTQALENPKVVKGGKHLSRQDAIKWLEKNVRIGFMENSEIMRISFAAGEPEQRIAIVQAVADAYLVAVRKREEAKAEFELKTLQQLVKNFQDRLKHKKEERELLRNGFGQENHQIKRDLVRDQIAAIWRERLQVQLGQAAARVKLTRLREKEKPSGQKEASAAKLEEEIAVLADQEKMLDRLLQQQMIEGPQRQPAALDEIEEQIEQTQRVLRRARERLDAVNVNMQAESRITFFQRAIIMGE